MARNTSSLWIRVALVAIVLGIALVGRPASAAGKVSPPVSALITDYYVVILGRQPDSPGQVFWEGEAQRLQILGADVNEMFRVMATSFFESPEYLARNRTDAAYVGDLYEAFFRRSPDASGQSFWTGQLTQGLPRSGVLQHFQFSAEFDAFMVSRFGNAPARENVDVVMDLYRGMLGRLPDTGGLSYWSERLRLAQCAGQASVTGDVDTISALFLGSTEYAGRQRSNAQYVADLYNAFMRRGPDVAGLQHWIGELNAGRQTREGLRQLFRDSNEFRARVAAVVAEGCITIAQASNLGAGTPTPGASPFVSFVELRGLGLEKMQSVRFTVASKPTAASRPVSVTLARTYLTRLGYLGDGLIRLPVFGLYAGYANQVAIVATFADGSTKALGSTITTASWVDPLAMFGNPTILKQRPAGSALGFDFFYLKAQNGTPLVIDSDAEVRWWMPAAGLNSLSSMFAGGAFLVGDQFANTLRVVQLDGTRQVIAMAGGYTAFHHQVERGKVGYLGEFDKKPENIETILAEFLPDGSVLREWDFARIIADHMRAAGENPDLFVRSGVDWFHMNSAIYDPRDDSIIASGREDFVIKVGYATGAILWILGDPTKYWYTFPSLRAKALTLEAGGLYPIGQHALSIANDGTLMLFDNGVGSRNQPAGAPTGQELSYSAVMNYSIDPVGRTARETARFDYGQTVQSGFCSSGYQASDNSLFITYSYVNGGTRARLVGLDSQRQVVFDFQYSTGVCSAWNGDHIPFHAMTLN